MVYVGCLTLRLIEPSSIVMAGKLRPMLFAPLDLSDCWQAQNFDPELKSPEPLKRMPR